MKKNILTLLVVVQVLALRAQDLENFYQYTLDWANINNAYVGSNRSIDWLLMSRVQFNKIPNSPKNYMGLIQMGLSEKQGIGVKVISDTRGIFGLTRFDGAYSQKFDLSSNVYMRVGVSFGVLNSNLNLSRISNSQNVIDTNDPAFSSSDYNYTKFVSGFGAITKIKQLELGVSAPHLVGSESWKKPFLFATASYEYELPGSPITLKPAVVFQNRPLSTNVVDGFINVKWHDYVNVIAGYSSDSRLKAGVCFNYKNLGLRYLNDNPVGSNTLVATSSNELALTIRFNVRSRESADLKTEIQKLIDETMVLQSGDYDKTYLKKRISEINKQLDKLTKKNSKATAKEVEAEINELEKQLDLIIEKYKIGG